jgi:phosphate butyryltransferase
VLLVPTIEAGNILGKAFSWLAGKPVAHVIEGARAPVLIPSRVERADDKLLSIALGALSAQGGE